MGIIKHQNKGCDYFSLKKNENKNKVGNTMKTKSVFTLAIAGVLATSLFATAWAKPPKMKMSTEVPAGIAAP